MRRFGMVGGLVSVLLAVAYVLPTSAIAGATRQDSPFGGTIVNCNGEVVAYSGVNHQVFNVANDGGGGFNVVDNSHAELTATGDKGDNYVGRWSLNDTEHAMPGEVISELLTVQLVSKGSAPNFDLLFHFHMTETPAGTLTSYLDGVTSSCTG